MKTKVNLIPKSLWKSNWKNNKGGEISANKGIFEPNKSKHVTTPKVQPKDNKSKGKLSNI